MIKYILFVFFAIGIVLALFFFFVGVPRIYKEKLAERLAPHAYDNKDISIEHIDVLGLYFVPKDRTDALFDDWEEYLSSTLENIRVFHEHQFLGRSTMTYRLYAVPIIGRENGEAYDIPLAEHRNVRALGIMQEELRERVDMSGISPGAYPVFVVMYEGVAATGGENIAVLSRFFFTDEQQAPFRDTFLAHEFYHALGAPDRYIEPKKQFADGQIVSGEVLLSEDLMGRIRVPLQESYIERAALEQFGI